MNESPRIYVACLASYNNGCLHGAWIDADQPVDDIWSEVQAMLAASPENTTCQWCGAVIVSTDPLRWDKPCTHGSHLPGHAEELAIHDYEGFGSLRLSEYEQLERVAAIAAGIAEHGEAFAAWLSYDDSRDPGDHQAFEDAYRGVWDSLRDYAQNYAEEVGMYDAAEKTGFAHVTVDIDMLERDLDIEMYTAPAENYHVHVFDPNV